MANERRSATVPTLTGTQLATLYEIADNGGRMRVSGGRNISSRSLAHMGLLRYVDLNTYALTVGGEEFVAQCKAKEGTP
jgi:hypothetical protein